MPYIQTLAFVPLLILFKIQNEVLIYSSFFIFHYKIVFMDNEFIEKFNSYLKTRGLFFFIIFLIINLIAYINKINIFVDILSHFRLQYLFAAIIFFIMFLYLLFSAEKIYSTLVNCINSNRCELFCCQKLYRF